MSSQDNIPILQLKQSATGIRIEHVNEGNIKSLMKESLELHRDDYYLSVLLKTGKADFFVEFKNLQLGKSTLFLLYPGQIHRLLSFSKFSGWMLFFDPKLVDDQSRIVLEQSLYEQNTAPLAPEEAKWFSHVLEAISIGVNNDRITNFRNATVQSLLAAFIHKTASIYLSREKINMARHTSRSIDITKSFRQLLRGKFRELKSPSEYASLMNLSLSYLNDTVRRVTGFSVTYYIQQEVIREAQRLLCHTDLSVKEISNLLNFDDAKYFNRLFSRVSGHSPGAFRREFNRDFLEKGKQ